MKCPNCKALLRDANFFVDTFDDEDADLAQVVVTHPRCGYIGYVLLTGSSLVEVKTAPQEGPNAA